MNYYNEWDKPTAAWLQELINQGLIPNGHIDTRSIADVQPGDLNGYIQCHFFAGIGGWPLALQLAGWPADRPVWTGSCPCQPFSAAGKRKGQDDERHVWPEFFRLIRECRPDSIIGEQVEGAVGHGWLDGVFADLEGEGYTCGAAVLGAHSAGAPHMRQRLYWVADGAGQRNKRIGGECCGEAQKTARSWRHKDRQLDELVASGTDGCVADSRYKSKRGWPEPNKQEFAATFNNCELGQSNSEGLERAHDNANASIWVYSMPSQSGSELVYATSGVCTQGDTSITSEQHDQTNPWRGRTAISCADGKARRIGPGITPVAHGIPARVVRVRGYGNAIVPQVAAEFIGAYMECSP